MNSSSCQSHHECKEKGTYCTSEGSCESLVECPIMKDSVTDECPLIACNLSKECNTASYCGEGGSECYCAAGEEDNLLCYPKKIASVDVCKNDVVRSALGVPSCGDDA